MTPSWATAFGPPAAQIFAGIGSAEHQVGHVDLEGGVFAGTGTDTHDVGLIEEQRVSRETEGYSTYRPYAGRYDANGLIFHGEGAEEIQLGDVEASGAVYLGTGADRALIGRVEPSTSLGGGAALALLIAAPKSGSAAAQGSQESDPPVDFEAGAAAVSAICRALNHHRWRAPNKPTKATAPPSHPPTGMSGSDTDEAAIPPQVEALLADFRTLVVPDIVDKNPSGLRWQYQVGLINEPELRTLLKRQHNIHEMIARGIWKP